MGVQNNNPIPRTPRSAVVAFGNAHKDIFTANAAAIGLLPADAVAFKGAVDDAAAKLAAQELAKDAYRSATTNTNKSFGTLLTTQGDVIRKIRAFAESSGNSQAIYSLAQIPPVATPSVAPPPAQPTNLRVTLDTVTGWINLGWKASNPEGTAGTSYIIKRKVAGAGEWTFIGVTGVKRFTDKNFFAGPDSVQYLIQGQRGDQSGPANSINVTFGQSPEGAMTAFVTGEAKLAA